MENEKSLKHIIETTVHPDEPNLARALLSIFGDSRIVGNANDERLKIYSEASGLKSKLEKLEDRLSRPDLDPQDREITLGRRNAIMASLTAIDQAHPELTIGNAETYTAAANEWIAWARKMSEWYRNLCEHPQCSWTDLQTFERIANRYDSDVEDVEKFCRSVGRYKSAHATFTTKSRYDRRRILADFVQDVDNFIEEYQRQKSNITKELAEVINRLAHPVQLVQTKGRKRRRRAY